MHNPIAIEAGIEATACGVVVPDLPGCYSARDAISAAEEVAARWRS